MAIEEVPLAKLIFDPVCQPRVSMDMAYVGEWTERYRDPDYQGPAIIAYYDEDADEYYVADGFCRGFGAKAAKRETINTDLRTGTRRDAWKCSLGANATHGLRRTNDDLRKAIASALRDPEFVTWANNKIADELIGCTQPTVSGVREELESQGVVKPQAKLLGKDGRWLSTDRKAPSAQSTSKLLKSPTTAASEPLPATARKTSAADAQQAAADAIAAAAEVLTGVPATDVDSPLDAQPEETTSKVLKSTWKIEVKAAVAERLAAREQFREALNLCDKLNGLLNDLCKAPGGEALQRECQYEEKNGATFFRNKHLKNVRADIVFTAPFAPCPYCHGRDEKCDGCKGYGYVTKAVFNAAPEELRNAVKAND